VSMLRPVKAEVKRVSVRRATAALRFASFEISPWPRGGPV